jgi:hypothetical protein
MQDDHAGMAPRRIALAGDEAGRRKVVLARLQDALAARGAGSVLVGRHILSLRGAGPARRSGPGDPELHVYGAGCRHVVTTDGRQYQFADGGTHPADDPHGAAGRVVSASTCDDDGGTGRPDSVAPEHRDGGRGGVTPGAGERALRRLRDDGII